MSASSAQWPDSTVKPWLAARAGQLGDQPGLAHAGVAADQHDDGLAGLGLGQQGGQAAQLSGTADQRRPGRVRHGIPRV